MRPRRSMRSVSSSTPPAETSACSAAIRRTSSVRFTVGGLAVAISRSASSVSVGNLEQLRVQARHAARRRRTRRPGRVSAAWRSSCDDSSSTWRRNASALRHLLGRPCTAAGPAFAPPRPSARRCSRSRQRSAPAGRHRPVSSLGIERQHLAAHRLADRLRRLSRRAPGSPSQVRQQVGDDIAALEAAERPDRGVLDVRLCRPALSISSARSTGVGARASSSAGSRCPAAVPVIARRARDRCRTAGR